MHGLRFDGRAFIMLVLLGATGLCAAFKHAIHNKRAKVKALAKRGVAGPIALLPHFVQSEDVPTEGQYYLCIWDYGMYLGRRCLYMWVIYCAISGERILGQSSHSSIGGSGTVVLPSTDSIIKFPLPRF